MRNGKKENKLLTAPNIEWEKRYVEGKLKPQEISFFKKLFVAAEIYLDALIRPKTITVVDEIHGCAELLVDFEYLGKDALVVGCGPTPETIIDLVALGYAVTGIEPVTGSINKAKGYLAGRGEVVYGTAEKIPVSSESQSLVIMENVLEHVDSVKNSLSEVFRILKPGGVLFVRTTNRTRFSITGINWEFTTRFYNWFPDIVKESYVYSQLHYHPELANFSPRPAVHWFSYAGLCKMGREEGFARFYSPFDLLCLINDGIGRGNHQRIFGWRKSPWIRAVAVSQMPCDIFMWKRGS